MATTDITKVVSVPGRLVKDPTSLAGSYPYGGTSLGAIRAAMAIPDYRYAPVEVDEWGGEASDLLYLGASWKFLCVFRGLDYDATGAVFPNTSASGGYRNLTHPGTVEPGTLLASTAIKLLFVPDDVTTAEAVYFPRAIPFLAKDCELQQHHDAVREFAAGFLAIRTSGGAAVTVALLSRITL